MTNSLWPHLVDIHAAAVERIERENRERYIAEIHERRKPRISLNIGHKGPLWQGGRKVSLDCHNVLDCDWLFEQGMIGQLKATVRRVLEERALGLSDTVPTGAFERLRKELEDSS